jgi:hypothetical protein
LQFPRCTTAPPEAPHKPINHGKVPVHFYRIEFRRLDGEDYRTHWKDWYPWMLQTGKLTPKQQPGSSPANDSLLTAPNNYRLLYEDGHVRLLEVTIRPGETTPSMPIRMCLCWLSIQRLSINERSSTQGTKSTSLARVPPRVFSI